MKLTEHQKSIAEWRDGEHKANLWWARLLKKIRLTAQRQSTELELFRDAFEFETGIDSRSKEGKPIFMRAVAAHLQRAAEHKERRLEAEMNGPLGDFDDEAMEPLPGEEDFAREIRKQQKDQQP